MPSPGSVEPAQAQASLPAAAPSTAPHISGPAPALHHADGPPPPFASQPHRTRRSPAHYARAHHAHSVGILPAVQSLLFVLVVALFLITFTVQPIRIPSSSMEPTLLVGDFLLLDKQASAPGTGGGLLPPSGVARGDIVVFHDPVDNPSIHLVKRVIALPGDRLHLRDGTVFLNGHPLHESYTIHRPSGPDTFRDDFPLLQSMDPGVNPDWWIRLRRLVQEGDGEISVPPGQYFVLGDNRNNSEDSRYWGFVPAAAIVGEPVLIYFSWKLPDPDGDAPPASAAIDSRPADPPSSARTSSLASFARWDRVFRVVH